MPLATLPVSADMGEAFGLHSFGNDEALLPLVDWINVACGFHAGDPEVMADTVQLAHEAGVGIGAHPGLPDLAGFGRRRIALTPREVENLIDYQVGALTGFLRRVGAPLSHIKPHGALWGMLAGDEELMRAAGDVVKRYRVPFLGLAGTAHERVCREMGIPFVGELYVDMGYTPDGNLALVRRAGETDPDEAADRVRTALAGEPVLAVDGTPVTLRFDGVCVHSDSRTAPAVARAVRDAIDTFQR